MVDTISNYLSVENARLLNLTDRLTLENPEKKFLAYLAHPRGGTTIMEVYRILDENKDGYILKPVTPDEKRQLIRQYSRGGAYEGFSFNARVNQRVGD